MIPLHGPGMHDWLMWELEVGKRAARAWDEHDAWGSYGYTFWAFEFAWFVTGDDRWRAA